MMEPLEKVLERISGGTPEEAIRNRTAKLKRLAHDEEPYRVEATKPAEALFYFAARSLYRNDSRDAEIRRMEMRRLEVAFERAEKQREADRRMIRADAWKDKRTEEVRTKIFRKAAGKDVPESWEELAVKLAKILNGVPEEKEET